MTLTTEDKIKLVNRVNETYNFQSVLA